MSLPDLSTERLRLRSVQPDDLDGIARQIGDFDVAKMLTTVPHPYAVEDAWQWFEQTTARQDRGERAFAIDDGTGLIGVVSVGRPGDAPEFGYWLGKDRWGRGLMTEAGRAVLAWHFECCPETPIMSGALNENRTSLGVLAKLGFSEAGPYELNILSRGEALPATRMRLTKGAFDDNERLSS